MLVNENSLAYKIKYFSYFITRAFLISIICLLVLIALIASIYFGDLFLNVKSGNYNSPLFNGYVIVSQSMVPTININDAIVVKRENNDHYNIGDIISFFTTEFDHAGIVVTHRIVGKKSYDVKESFYTTKGDNNPVPDMKSVATKNVYGKVMFIIPKLGYIQSFLSQPVHFIICILIPAGFVILYDIYRIVRSTILKKDF